MLTQDNFTKENIDRLCLLSGNDPSLLEKTVCAFGLLEAISKVRLKIYGDEQWTSLYFLGRIGYDHSGSMEEPRSLIFVHG